MAWSHPHPLDRAGGHDTLIVDGIWQHAIFELVVEENSELVAGQFHIHMSIGQRGNTRPTAIRPHNGFLDGAIASA